MDIEEKEEPQPTFGRSSTNIAPAQEREGKKQATVMMTSIQSSRDKKANLVNRSPVHHTALKTQRTSTNVETQRQSSVHSPTAPTAQRLSNLVDHSSAKNSTSTTVQQSQSNKNMKEEEQPSSIKRSSASTTVARASSTASTKQHEQKTLATTTLQQATSQMIKPNSMNLCHPTNQHQAVGTFIIATELDVDEIADLKRFHDNSLAATTRKAYVSDYKSFLEFLEVRFPSFPLRELQTECTLEHVLAYLNQLCNDGKKISTINRRLSTLKKHILPGLFNRPLLPGSREELMMQEMDAIVRGMRRTIGGEQRIRGKKPLLIENIRAMCAVAKKVTDADSNAMPNKQCRDVCLLLFMFYSAMRRSEIQHLLWTDLTFDKRGVVVLIRHSKTDKESKGQTIALPRLDDNTTTVGAASDQVKAVGVAPPILCPVRALEAWRDKSVGIAIGDSPVFRWISKKDEIQFRVLIDQRMVAIIKDYAAQIGLDEKCYSCHSSRSGYVTTCSDRGVPISEMMKRTRHKSISSLSVYMKNDDLFKGASDSKL